MDNILSLKLNEDNDEAFLIEKILFNILNKTIIFIYDNIKYQIDYANQIFIRENEEFYFQLDFKNKKSIYKLKEKNIILDIKVINCNFLIKKDSILMKYMIESDEKENIIKIDILKGVLL